MKKMLTPFNIGKGKDKEKDLYLFSARHCADLFFLHIVYYISTSHTILFLIIKYYSTWSLNIMYSSVQHICYLIISHTQKLIPQSM